MKVLDDAQKKEFSQLVSAAENATTLEETFQSLVKRH